MGFLNNDVHAAATLGHKIPLLLRVDVSIQTQLGHHQIQYAIKVGFVNIIRKATE